MSSTTRLEINGNEVMYATARMKCFGKCWCSVFFALALGTLTWPCDFFILFNMKHVVKQFMSGSLISHVHVVMIFSLVMI